MTPREIDVLIAEKVMGIERDGGCLGTIDGDRYIEGIPHYSTRIEDAWLVVKKMKEIKNQNILVEVCSDDEFICAVGIHHRGMWIESFRAASKDSAPMAICLAALESIA